MSADVFVPALGVAMDEALLVRWIKQPGEPVETDEPVAEIETDKATMELVAPCAGFLGAHLFAEGAAVPVGEVLARVVATAEAALDETASAVPAETPGDAAAIEDAPPADGEAPFADAPERPRRASPRMRRLAREGVEAAAEPQGERRDFREIIATRVTESWRTIPHFAVTRAVDADALLAAHARARQTIDVRITLTDFLVAALAAAVAEVDGPGQVDIGLAVATERGVAIPVLRDVLALDLASLADSRQAAVERARQGRLGEDDVREPAPTTTLSNLGALGVDHFTGVVALGQQSLLTVGQVVRQAVVDEAGAIVARARFNATLNADHRALDGADSAALLAAFARSIGSLDDQ